MDVTSLETLFHEQLQDLHSAESQILEALPRMMESARNDDLRSALGRHLDETRRQKERLEEIGRSLDLEMDGPTCKGMAGIISEGEDLLQDEVQDDDVMDAAIIAAAQRVEHYEIAGYGTACSYAQMLGRRDVLDRLKETLDEEYNADRKLTDIAEQRANREAAQAD